MGKTVFGEFELSRRVYGPQERKAIQRIPTDQRLPLPENDVSSLLQEWDQLLGIEQALGVVRDTLNTILRIKDRRERSGMRWKIPGAQAMLALRTIHTNGDRETFQDFRVRHKNQRLYPHAEKFQANSWPLKFITA